jgi:hypothetical protein
MDAEPTISAAAYLSQLRAFIAAGDDRQALEYSARVWMAVAPHLTAAELAVASGLLEGAETALELVEREHHVSAGSPEAPIR